MWSICFSSSEYESIPIGSEGRLLQSFILSTYSHTYISIESHLISSFLSNHCQFSTLQIVVVQFAPRISIHSVGISSQLFTLHFSHSRSIIAMYLSQSEWFILQTEEYETLIIGCPYSIRGRDSRGKTIAYRNLESIIFDYIDCNQC